MESPPDSHIQKVYAFTWQSSAIKTVNALRAAGKQEQAAARLAQWLQQHPDDLRAQLFKAETLLADKQFQAAAEQLESTLKQHPKNAVALNNLALAYQQTKDPRAQQAAEEAYKLADPLPHRDGLLQIGTGGGCAPV
ncbi:hypothetical protein [Polaromonas naphthalenivorans]|uniref:Uncharacterized protein n=1 Tax=Polaromonas naphthalenivorans (strain CJ2) TaxID=365044 RepID=A1VWY2_POLNA|nr:hypothetical protein [Polaromonas naphthalenivorans]ABM40160.1 hypothetical protein Pnap_4749 [Polaromonas naphthalenivorans CJ2]